MPACWPTAIRILLLAIITTFSASAGWVDEKDGQTVIHLKLWQMPDPTRTDTKSQADWAVVKSFYETFPKIFAEKYAAKYKANPEKYGDYDWDNIKIDLQRFSGITIEGQSMDSGPLMAIAGGVAPDILYVNFRQSDTYIQQGFLYPLDKEEDGYIAGMTPEETEFQIHPKTWPVIRRKGPGGDVHVWAKPTGGVLGKVMVYRKDLLDEAGVAEPTSSWTWEDLYEASKKITDPSRGRYGIGFGRGPHESWYWVTFLWSAGGEVMNYNEETDEWRAAFASPEAALAVDYYTKLCAEIWYDADGKRRYGYAAKESDTYRKWSQGQIGFLSQYIDEKLFSTINPDLVGMVPVPVGPGGNRGGELNSRMQGIFSGVKDPVVRDAAWEYLRYIDSEAAMRIQTRIMVEGGLGRFVNPRYLRKFGYEDIIRLAPKGWEEIFNVAIETGQPEPYGRNCQLVYEYMTTPLQEMEKLSLDDALPKVPKIKVESVSDKFNALEGLDEGTAAIGPMLTQSVEDQNTERLNRTLDALEKAVVANPDNTGLIEVRDELAAAISVAYEARLGVISESLKNAAKVANEKMIGVLSPEEQFKRRAWAAVVLFIIALGFIWVFRKIIRTFTPPVEMLGEKQERWGFRKYLPAYIILIPAVGSIFLWQYIPLVIGSVMAFQDYQIVGESKWVGIDNFANLLWDGAWWATVWNSIRYSMLVISLTFLPPVILAVLLDEIPIGKIFFRTLFYLPAVITGLVVIYLWRSFYEPTEFGVLNTIVMGIPLLGYMALAIFLFAIMHAFAERLHIHQSYWQSHLCNIVAVAMFIFAYGFADNILLFSELSRGPLVVLSVVGISFWLWSKALVNYHTKELIWLSVITIGALVLLTFNSTEMGILIKAIITSNYGSLGGDASIVDWHSLLHEGRLTRLQALIVGFGLVVGVVVKWAMIRGALANEDVEPGVNPVPFETRMISGAIYWVIALIVVIVAAGMGNLFTFLFEQLLTTQPEPLRWLLKDDTAMLCCVIPMIWAGMGPGCLIYLAALKGVAPDFYEAADIDGATFVDKILFVVLPILKPLLIINFVGVFIGAFKSSAFILAMTGGSSQTEVAGLHIFYKAYMHLQFGPAAAMAWVLGFMLIGFTLHQLQILSRLEFKTTGGDK